MAQSASYYVHGSSAGEQGRLSIMNQLLNEGCLREMRLVGGERILDLGSGTGQFTRMMARMSGVEGDVVGIERNADQLAEAKRLATAAGEGLLVDFRAGDAAAPQLTDVEWGSFDVAHTRFLLEHVPKPQTVVDNMVRAVRLGGRIVLADDDHANFRPWPEPDGFAPLWEAYIQSYSVAGNDPFIGRRLVEMLHAAGAEQTRNSVIFFGGCNGDSRFDAVAENLIRVVEGARGAIVGARLLDEGSFEAGMDGLRDWKERPMAALWYYVCWAEGYRTR